MCNGTAVEARNGLTLRDKTSSMKKQILFIINPISGTRHKQSISTDIEAYLDHTRFDYEIKFTEHAGHASEMAREAAQKGIDIVVAVGGDGTVNEVARSLVHSSTALGIIPCGSGNGLARHLQIPQTPRKAIEILNCDTIHCLDYGRINDVPFFCTCGMGFDAFVSQKFAESGKRGLLQYVKNTIGVGLTYKPETYIIEHENGREKVDAFLIACANASQYGNNAFIAPTASMKDGLMDIIIMAPFPTLEGAYVALQMFTKNLLSNSHVKMFKAKEIKIIRSMPGAVHCDGDPLVMGKEIKVELVKQSFNVVVNPEAHSKRKGYLQELSDRLDELVSRVTSGKEEETDRRVAAAVAFDPSDKYHLQRFVEAQQNVYGQALQEVQAGKKLSHWMWFIFPQLVGLGQSQMSKRYGITCREEAEQYLLHPLLGSRLQEISEELLHLDGLRAYDIFGFPDDMKLRSCMTLFSSISEDGNVFERVLNKYFNGQPCQLTLTTIKGRGE